jgi:hypothetical protein
MSNFALICALALGCTASDGTTQPTGTVMAAPIVWDGVSAYSPAGMSVVPYTGQTPYAPAPLAPTVAQLAATLLAGGITITSTSTPALNGTYAIDAAAQANINAVQTYILTTPGTFPSGATQPWVDMSGAVHVFANTAQFTAFAKAAAQIAAQVTLYGAGALPSPPAMSATIP